jgi:hypothetical protein
LGAMEIGSQKSEIPERFGDIKSKTDTLSKLSVLVPRGRVLSYASVTAYGDPLTISKITPAAQDTAGDEVDENVEDDADDDVKGVVDAEVGYGFVSPSAFASPASSILTGMSLGRVQFLKRCGTTA